MASTRLVLPSPLLPTNTVGPGPSARSTRSQLRKEPSCRCRTYTFSPAWRRFSNGPPAGARAGPARRGGQGGPSSCGLLCLLRLDGVHRVPAELVAQGGDRLHRRRVVLAGDEAGEQRGGDRRHRHGVLDALLDGPPAFAGVLGVPGDALELGVLLQ